VRGDEVRVEFDHALNEKAESWQFCLLNVEPDHAAAVGVDSSGAPLSLRARRIVPLGER